MAGIQSMTKAKQFFVSGIAEAAAREGIRCRSSIDPPE